MSNAPTVNPPHKIGVVRWARVKEAFRDGGYVSATEVDAYLMLESGTTKKAILDGAIPYTVRPRGQQSRYFVHAYDAEDALGIKRKRTVAK